MGIHFQKNLFVADIGKTKIKMNKPVYLRQTIFNLSKTLMYEFYCDYVQCKYGINVRKCCMDTDSFVYKIETEDFYKEIAKDVENKFGISGYTMDDNRPLPIRKNKKVIDMAKV